VKFLFLSKKFVLDSIHCRFEFHVLLREGREREYQEKLKEYREVKVLKIMQLLPFASIYLLKAQIGTEIY
jgi:hypothetical protein